jgi:hypothetical protein
LTAFISAFEFDEELTHNQEADSDCLRDPDELVLVRLWGMSAVM